MASGIDTNVLSIMSSGDVRMSMKRSGNIKHIICHRTQRICFILTDTKTIVSTTSGAFLLEPLVVPGDLWRRRLEKIRRLILSRNIKCYDDLIGLCRPGITMTLVRIEWYV